ncbi:MAG: hypothetical protein JNM09_27175 [Blastocatellia bacterium]|nr:hypothetical protein [Blastocatellia bacterium]
MANYRLKCETAKINASPRAFLVYAADFLNAHKSYKSAKPFSPASYYLVCRSLELSLKAYLLANGVTRQEIKNQKMLGHDLQKLLQKAVTLKINSISSISPTQEQEIQKANGWYARKGFEYFELQNLVDGNETLPDMSVLIEIADQLIVDLKPLCLSVA